MRRQQPRPATGFIARLACIAALIGGCEASGPNAVPHVSDISDRAARTATRERAIEHAWEFVREGESTRPDMRETLKRIIWSRATAPQLRVAALNQLLSDDAGLDDTRNMLSLMLPTETQWEFLDSAATVTVDRGWTDLAPTFVRSWSRPPVPQPPDDQRPERRALAGLFPDRPVEDSVFAVLVGDAVGRSIQERERAAAWALLRRIDPSNQRTLDLVSRAPDRPDDALLDALRAGAMDLHAIPDTTEQLAWLQRLREPQNRSWWDDAALLIRDLPGEALHGFELRHVTGVVWAGRHASGWLGSSREALLSELDARLRPLPKHQRTDGHIPGSETGELLRDWKEKMVWGDVLLTLIALEATHNPIIAPDLFLIADQDYLDRSTEHGGVLDGTPDGGFVAISFPPRASQRFGDNRFVASEEMLARGDTALFHFHMHATTHRGSHYAGPSSGDFEYARTLGRSCIVFTFISKDVLNIDYFQPNGVRLDMGEVRRPSKP